MNTRCCVDGCAGEPALLKKPLNGCPAGVWICASCLEAVKHREVGIVRLSDGTLHVTDGRYKHEPA